MSDRSEEILATKVAIEAAVNGAGYFFVDDSNVAYVFMNGKAFAIDSSDFEYFCRNLWLRANPELIALPSHVKAIQAELSSIAYGSPNRREFPLWTRVRQKDGKLWLNMGDWRVIEITKDGWEIKERSEFPVFRQSYMRPYPTPVRGGNINELRNFVNLSDSQFKLYVGFLLAGLRESKENPTLLIHGGDGAGKTSMSTLAMNIIDPAKMVGSKLPSDEKDLGAAARMKHLISYDNVSFMKQDMSDALCRIGTGYTYEARKFYTNSDYVWFTVYRPVVINGIPNTIDRLDLARRVITVRVETLELKNKRSESEYWDAFGASHPRIFGAILDGLSCALGRINGMNAPTLGLKTVADWVEAAAPALGWVPGEFIAAYDANREETIQILMESDDLAKLIGLFMEKRNEPYYATFDSFMNDAKGCHLVTANVEYFQKYFRNSKTFFSAMDRLRSGLLRLGIEFKRQGRVDNRQQFSLVKV